MSDLCMYEFEDIVWDVLSRSDDHLVPLSDAERPDCLSILGDVHKKPRRDIASMLNNTEDRSAMKYIDQGREERELSSVSDRTTMLEKDSWSHAPCAFPASSDSDSIKEPQCAASDNTTIPNHAAKNNNTGSKISEFGANDSLLGDKTSAADKSSLSYPVSNISYADNNFNFSGNTEDKDSSDFLFYDLPEIENFEDVDRMFRSCDSTFGLGTSKEDELGWLASANTEGLVDGLRSDFKITCPETNALEKVSISHESSKNYSINESVTTNAHMSYKGNSWTSEKPGSFISFVNGATMADKPEGLNPKEQINEHKKQFMLQDQSLGKRKEPCFTNGGFNYLNNEPNEILQMGSEAISDQDLLQKQTLSPHSSNYLQNPLSYMHSDNSHLSSLTSVYPTLSPVKSEPNDMAFISPRGSSHASNQLQFMEGSRDPQSQVTAPGSGRREKLHNRQGRRSSVSSNLKKQSATVQAATSNPVLIGKQAQLYEDKVENHSDVEGVSLVIPGELGSSSIQESSTISSGMDYISLEAASFQQLQIVMEQLDLRTKLCIRDSLYRLARSAEQRHNRTNFPGGCGPERDANGAFAADATNDFMDMETDTNPIDRSIAHLLFHRPLESSATPPGVSLPFKSPNVVRGSITSTPVMVENSAVCEEATASDVEKMSNG